MVQYAVRCAASQELNIDANLYKKKNRIKATVTTKRMVLLLPTVSADFQDIYEVNEATKPTLQRNQQ